MSRKLWQREVYLLNSSRGPLATVVVSARCEDRASTRGPDRPICVTASAAAIMYVAGGWKIPMASGEGQQFFACVEDVTDAALMTLVRDSLADLFSNHIKSLFDQLSFKPEAFVQTPAEVVDA